MSHRIIGYIEDLQGPLAKDDPLWPIKEADEAEAGAVTRYLEDVPRTALPALLDRMREALAETTPE